MMRIIVAVTMTLVFAAVFCERAAGADVLEITKDTALDPAKTYGATIIKASNVTVDGHGAWLVGAKVGKDGEPKPNAYKGVAIYAKGVSNVRLVDINAKGWETGLAIEDGEGWVVEDCNFEPSREECVATAGSDEFYVGALGAIECRFLECTFDNVKVVVPSDHELARREA